MRAIYRIQARPDGPAQARRIVGSELSAVVSKLRLEEVALMVSELVTNGIRHGNRDTNAAIVLDLRLNDEINCAVIDHGPGFREGEKALERNGWGLKVVDRLADRWGITRSHGCTRVWFETRAQ